MSSDLQLAKALRTCGVTISDEEMRDPARLKIVLQQVRKSVRMCEEVLANAQFGMDNEDWNDDDDDDAMFENQVDGHKMSGLAKKLQACGVNVTERELSNPETLKRLRKSVNECQALFARFGMDDDDENSEEDDDENSEEDDDEKIDEGEQAHAEDVAIAERLSSDWVHAGYPPFYYDGGDHLQFNYEPAENASYIGETEDITEAIADIRFLVHRKQYNVAMWVSAGGLPRRVELFFRGRIPPMREIREIEEDLITGIVGLKRWRPEKHGSVYDESEADLDLVDKLNRYWEKARRPAVLYDGSEDIEFNPAVRKIPKMVATTSSLKDVLLAMRKLRRIGYKDAFVTVDADFKNNHLVFFHGIHTPVDTFRHYLRDYGTLDITLVRY
jgi:hypothetical protein